MNYGDYLHLDELLGAQKPLSGQSDEMLFIIIHQSSELWMKLVLHELDQSRAYIAADRVEPAFKCLARVSRIQAQMIQAWDILATMTPSEYAAFRGQLGTSSGFQSFQYRLIEFSFGNRQAKMIAPHADRPERVAQLEAAIAAPSLYDEAIRYLSRHGFAIDRAVLERDLRQTHVSDPSVAAAWLAIYREPDRYWTCYQLAEKLMDLDHAFQNWRFCHLTTVQRIIGLKRGTGGTDGVGYLRRATEIIAFPELWEMRTAL